ncbi:hypothetical protein BGP76_07630 [Reichenbachiella sp. MSK19-1]|nr:hypothetical protein BGP76_07630 [Reichenbachiella sp. MSK19-1]
MLGLACGSCSTDNKQESTSMEDRKEKLVEEFGVYEEEVSPENEAYYKAYDKTLGLWQTVYHQVYVPTSYGEAHVVVSGPKDAEPLVLLHGMNASSTMWYPNAEALSKKYRIYAIDYLLEPGKSKVTGEVGSMEQVTDWYTQVVDGLKLERFTLVGASKGGWLAINYALVQRDRVDRLILLSPVQAFAWIKPGLEMVSNLSYAISPSKEDLNEMMSGMSVNADLIAEAYKNQYLLGTKNSEEDILIVKMRPFSDEKLETLDLPVLLLIGDDDAMNSSKTIKEAKKILPQVETETVKDAGHFLSVDQPELINQRILDFIEKHPVSTEAGED